MAMFKLYKIFWVRIYGEEPWFIFTADFWPFLQPSWLPGFHASLLWGTNRGFGHGVWLRPQSGWAICSKCRLQLAMRCFSCSNWHADISEKIWEWESLTIHPIYSILILPFTAKNSVVFGSFETHVRSFALHGLRTAEERITPIFEAAAAPECLSLTSLSGMSH